MIEGALQAMRHRVGRWLVRPGIDLPLLGALLVLMAIGLATLYSASNQDGGEVLGQGLRFVAGLVLLLAVSRVPPRLLRVWSPWVYVASVALLVVVAVLGEGRGAHRWLDLGVVRFQPSELLKLAIPMVVAWFIDERPLPPSWFTLAGALVLVGMPVALIAEQPDLGTALLVAASGLIAVFLAGLAWWRIGVLVAGAAAAAPVLWHFLHDYQRERVLTLLNPEADPLGTGWHIIQSKIAVGSGGLWGAGWLHGTQSRLEFLPEHTTDFIFSVFAEEWGLMGVLGLLALYAFIVGRCLWIAVGAKDTYSRLLAGSIGLTLFVYVLVNGGMVTGLLPVVGVPLPLVSYGGTSAISLLTAFGMLMSIHAHRKWAG